MIITLGISAAEWFINLFLGLVPVKTHHYKSVMLGNGGEGWMLCIEKKDRNGMYSMSLVFCVTL